MHALRVFRNVQTSQPGMSGIFSLFLLMTGFKTTITVTLFIVAILDSLSHVKGRNTEMMHVTEQLKVCLLLAINFWGTVRSAVTH
eukprot:2666108-Pleurochrysis_carterae.AAC.1